MTTTSPEKAPRFALALLRAAISDPEAREVILGDLEEELAQRRAQGKGGRLWFWRQALASAVSWRKDRREPANGRLLFTWPGRWQDVVHGLRLLRRSPAFTLVAVSTLAVGVAGATTVFSLVQAVLLAPLGYRQPDRVVLVGSANSSGVPSTIGFETLHDFRQQSRSFSSLELMRNWGPILVEGEAERLSGVRVTAGALSTLGLSPALGRDFRPEEDHPDRRFVVLLTDSLWRRRFSADPGVLGRFVTLSGRPFQVIGVLPPSFDPILLARSTQDSQPPEILAPLGYQLGQPGACRSCQHLQAFGRLADGVELEQARADLVAIQARLMAAYPLDYADARVGVQRAADVLTGPARPVLAVVAGAVACLLMIAAANLATLLLARGSARGRELRIRVALGGGRLRLVSQLLTENLLLSLAGGLLGFGLARLALGAVLASFPARLPRLENAALDARSLAFGLLVTVLSGLAAGLAPALGLSRSGDSGLASGGRAVGSSRQTGGRRALVVVNVALAFVLLVGAGLMIASVDRLLAVDPGFERSQVLALRLSLLGDRFATDEATLAGIDEVVERARALPGVSAAAIAGQVPLSGDFDTWGMEVEGRGVDRAEDRFDLQRYSVTPDYFAVLKLPLLAGRLIETSDRRTTEPVLLLSATAARQLFPGESALGKHLRFDGPDEPWRTVVGVVGDVRHEGLAANVSPQMYLPQSQRTDSFVTLVVRSSGPLLSLVPALRREIAAVAREIPVERVATLEQMARATAARERFTSGLLGAFSSVALLLAAVGLYGLIAFLVEGRRREVGLRMALGALRQDVARLVLAPGLLLVAAGVTLGWLLSLVLSRSLASLLYQTSPADLPTYAGIALLLALVALCAHLAPLRRALKVDPVTSLREG